MLAAVPPRLADVVLFLRALGGRQTQHMLVVGFPHTFPLALVFGARRLSETNRRFCSEMCCVS